MGGSLCSRLSHLGVGPAPAEGSLETHYQWKDGLDFPSVGPTHDADAGRAVRSLCPAPFPGCPAHRAPGVAALLLEREFGCAEHTA